jgi:hypothetical protein
MQASPDDQSLRLLRAAGVTYVVVAREWATPARLAHLQVWEAELQQLFVDQDTLVYRLTEVTRSASAR